jgi:hypothetical protein
MNWTDNENELGIFLVQIACDRVRRIRLYLAGTIATLKADGYGAP